MAALTGFRDRLAEINKRVINPLTLSFAGRPGVPYGIIQHIGRRSGNRYTTPVLVMRSEDGFYIPLPYGERTDWALNVQEEGGGLIVYQGAAYRVIEPRTVPSESAATVVPAWVTALLDAAGTRFYLYVRRAGSRPEPQTVYERVTVDYPVTTGVAAILGFFVLTFGAAWVTWRLLQRKRM